MHADDGARTLKNVEAEEIPGDHDQHVDILHRLAVGDLQPTVVLEHFNVIKAKTVSC